MSRLGTLAVVGTLTLVAGTGCDGTMEPFSADPGTAPAPGGIEQTGQQAFGPGSTDLGRFYRLRSARSTPDPLCLDVSGKSQSNGAAILQFTCDPTQDNRLWYARLASSSNEYQLSAKHSGKCMRPTGGGTGTGLAMVQDPCFRTLASGLDSTRMILTQIGTATPARYQIKIKSGGKCIRSPNSTSGQPVVTATCGTGSDFQWILEQQAFLGDSNDNGNWTAPVTLPLVPAAAALLPNRKVLVWSSWKPYRFGGTGATDQTVMGLFDPATGTTSSRTVTNTVHNMFCPGIAMLPDGNVFVNGGDDSHTKTTSIYRWQQNDWIRPAAMVESRWYNSSITMPNGHVFTLAGNRSSTGSDRSGRGEVWNGSSWALQTNATITDMLSGQPTSARVMEHPRLHLAPNGKIFVSGPSTRMQWYDPAMSYAASFAGLRNDDEASNNDITVMFDVNVNTRVARILKAGGNPSYDRNFIIDPGPTSATTDDITVAANYTNANHNSYVITLNEAGSVSIAKTPPMKWPRTFGNAVVLANGQVVAVGGLDNGKGFSDDGNIRPAELFDPATSTWKDLSAMDKPRPYHSIALLLDDGRVLVGGGGLCSSSDDCAQNHPDIELLSPPYLYSATRPGQPSVTGTITTGTTGIPVTVSGTVNGFSLVRLAGVTHSTNTDQRFMRLNFTNLGGGNYTISAPPNKNIAPPGYYMLFALNGQAPSSRAAMVRIQ